MGGANGMGGAGTGGRTGTGGMTGVGGATGGGGSTSIGVTCTPQTWDAGPIGWATQGSGTSGAGPNATDPTVVTSASQLTSALAGTASTLIHVSGKLTGDFRVGSNKTILGLCGAEVDGSLDLTNAVNVIVRNLKVVGHNCTDSPSDCSSGHDAVHVEGSARNLWFDHMDISDGSDGNLDITNGANFVTVSWTIFHYSSKRTDPIAGATGHRFCNLIGAADTMTSDAGLAEHHVPPRLVVGQRESAHAARALRQGARVQQPVHGDRRQRLHRGRRQLQHPLGEQRVPGREQRCRQHALERRQHHSVDRQRRIDHQHQCSGVHAAVRIRARAGQQRRRQRHGRRGREITVAQ